MPAFDAGAVVEALDWDFTKAGVNAKGTIPEPTDRAIGDFLDGLKKLYGSAEESGLLAGMAGDPRPEQMLDALSQLTGETFVKFLADLAGLFAGLCSNSPSADQMLALPLRVRVKFYSWVQLEVVNPEAGTGAGTAELRVLPSAAAG